MRIFPWRFVLVVATAVSVIGFPKPATATTFNVTVGPGFNLVFDPASVTISDRRSGKMDLGFQWPQHNLRLPGVAERHLELRSS
jgi:hypothetical protein